LDAVFVMIYARNRRAFERGHHMIGSILCTEI